MSIKLKIATLLVAGALSTTFGCSQSLPSSASSALQGNAQYRVLDTADTKATTPDMATNKEAIAPDAATKTEPNKATETAIDPNKTPEAAAPTEPAAMPEKKDLPEANPKELGTTIDKPIAPEAISAEPVAAPVDAPPPNKKHRKHHGMRRHGVMVMIKDSIVVLKKGS